MAHKTKVEEAMLQASPLSPTIAAIRLCGGAGGVGAVKEDAAGAAHRLGLGVTFAGNAVRGGDITAAVGLLRGGVRSVEADVALLAPGGGPGVADQPVLLAIVL